MIADIADADQEAADAAAAVAKAETKLAAGQGGVSPDALHRLRDRFRHARLSAEGLRAKADRDREAARVAGLEEIGRQVDALAESGLPNDLGEALQAITDACAKARSIARTWDTSITELIEAARDLDAEGMAPGGPRKTSAHLAVGDRPDAKTIIHQQTKLTPVSAQVAQAIEYAVLGRPYDGLALMDGASTLAEPQRPDFLLRGRNGMLLTVYGEPNQQFQNQIRSGDLTALPKSDIDAYMAGGLQ
jgi:hypothetical protein